VNYTVPGRAPRAPIVQPRPPADPAAFTLANIRTMQRVRIGWGRDRDFPVIHIAGADVLTGPMAREVLTTLGTIPEVVDALTDEQAIAAAEATIPRAERMAAVAAPKTTIDKVPVAGTVKAPTTTKLSFGTPTQTGGAVVKQNALAIEEYEALLPAQVFPILHTRTGRSLLVALNYDSPVGDPNPFTLYAQPIPFPCLITNVYVAIQSWWGVPAAGFAARLDAIGVGTCWQGTSRNVAGINQEGYPLPDGSATTNIGTNHPMHFLIPRAGVVLALTLRGPAAPPSGSVTVTCDEVDLAMIAQGYIKPRAEANAENIARQGTINIKRSRPVILTVG
jgi:hypothetical protein